MSSCNEATVVALSCEGGSHCRHFKRVLELEQQVAQLQNLVRTDELTGLYNYRFFSEMLPVEMERAKRGGTFLSLILLDIDFFKQFNDCWGHEAGNQALAHVAKVIQSALRKLDFPCRYGGEEFALILPSTQLACAIKVAERIREAISNSPLPLEQGQAWVTASLGVGCFAPSSYVSPESFVANVDSYLYSAKRSGRNQVKYPELSQVRSQTLVTDEEKTLLFNAPQDAQ